MSACDIHQPPNTVITAEGAHAEKWQRVYEPEWTLQTVDQLENRHKKQLMIWPFHTLVGPSGHSLSPALCEAICYHTVARQAQSELISKRGIPKTEQYSILESEVKVEGHPQDQLNERMLGELEKYDLIYMAGEAKSHCILETINSIMRYLRGQSRVISRLRILEDAMSSVVVSGFDIELMTCVALDKHKATGLILVKTEEGIG